MEIHMSQNSEELSATDSDRRVDVKPKCPECGHTEVSFRADAWEVRLLRGFDDDGEVILSEPDYEVFDDTHFECERCGYKCSEADEFYSEPTP